MLKNLAISFVLLTLQSTACLAEEGRAKIVAKRTLADSATACLVGGEEPYFSVAPISGLKPGDRGEDYFQIRILRQKKDQVDPSGEKTSAAPVLVGKYVIDGDVLRFRPRFPLNNQLRYQMQLGPHLRPMDGEEDKLEFSLPRETLEPTAKVLAVYPSSDQLPANLLKFYIHFSEPMKRGEAYRRVALYRGNERVEEPFLELGEELWDSEQTRFTLFIHPGRIKRGLKPREDSGPAISEGEAYSLKVDASWEAANGEGLVAAYEKRFSVLPEDHTQPDLESWKIETPQRGTRQAVGLRMNEPLDHAMLSRVLAVRDQDGQPVTGEVGIGDEERCWFFTPDEKWGIGKYYIDVAANLEDVCGNSVARPFETKMRERAAASPAVKVAIEFVVN